MWRIDQAGLLARTEPLPGDGRTLELDNALFAADAMILRDIASRGLTLEAGYTRIRMAWDNLADLGL